MQQPCLAGFSVGKIPGHRTIPLARGADGHATLKDTYLDTIHLIEPHAREAERKLHRLPVRQCVRVTALLADADSPQAGG